MPVNDTIAGLRIVSIAEDDRGMLPYEEDRWVCECGSDDYGLAWRGDPADRLMVWCHDCGAALNVWPLPRTRPSSHEHGGVLHEHEVDRQRPAHHHSRCTCEWTEPCTDCHFAPHHHGTCPIITTKLAP